MNEEALNVLYGLAQNDGYKDSLDDFRVLMSQNEDAVNTMYSLAQGDGYKDSIDDFKVLVGFTTSAPEPDKKKDVTTESPSEDGSLERQRYEQEKQQLLESYPTLEGEERNIASLQLFGESAITHDRKQAEKERESAFAKRSSGDQAVRQSLGLEDVDGQKVQYDQTFTYGDTEINIPQEGVSVFNERGIDVADPIRKASREGKFLPITPTDVRSTGYVDPVEEVSRDRFPSAEELKRAEEQKRLDIEYTQQKMRQEQPLLEKRLADEQIERFTQEEMVRRDRQEVIQSPEFESLVSQISDSDIDMTEEDFVKDFNEKYGRYGFVFTKQGIGDAVLVTAKDGSSTSIDLQPFFDSTNSSEAAKLKSFIEAKVSSPEDLYTDSDNLQMSVRANNLRRVPRINEDGSMSTVLMAAEKIDGKNVAFPTLFPTDPNNYSSDPRTWTEYSDPFEAYEVAKSRGEVFTFEDFDDAMEFAEGSWKRYNDADAEANKFFAEKNLDYTTFKYHYDKYNNSYDELDFIESEPPLYLDELTKDQQEKFGDKYYINGVRRSDYNKNVAELERSIDEIESSIILTDEYMEAREQFDIFSEQKRKEAAVDAVKSNYEAKQAIDAANQRAIDYFGVPVTELSSVEPADEFQVKAIESMVTDYNLALAKIDIAAKKYEMSETWLDNKFDKNLRSDFLGSINAVTTAISKGYSRGKAMDEVLMAAFGITDIDDDASREEVSRAIVEYLMEAEKGGMGKYQYRYQTARGFAGALKAFGRNPYEVALSFAGESMSMMLPYGIKIVPSSVATGALVGAGAGAASTAGVGAGAGAVSGAGWGFTTGMAATSLAMEYNNAVLEAITNQGYDIKDPESVAQALMQESVWAEGREIGLKRGIPIAAVDFLAKGMAGRIFKVGKVATKTQKAASFLGERLVFDPAMEALGETAAQLVAGQNLDSKEILAEAIGGFGNNASSAAVNMTIDAFKNNNVSIANDLMTIQGMAAETSSDSRIATWANNMERLGNITSEQNQRIQENIGLRREARETLGTDKRITRPLGRKNVALENRLMELLSAREDLSSTKNRKEVFAPKIREINDEIAEIVSSKTLRSPEKQTNFPAPSGRGFVESDTRVGVGKYMVRGKVVSRAEFLREVDRLTPNRITKMNPQVQNDDEVKEILNKKLDAIQEQETRVVPDVEQTTDTQEVETEVRVTPEEEVTVEEEVVVDEEVDEDTKSALLEETKDLEAILSEDTDVDTNIEADVDTNVEADVQVEEQVPTTEKSTIDELFEIKEDGTLPDGVVPVGTSVTSPMSVRLNQRGGRSEKSRGFSIKTVENAARAVSKILPDLRIVLHANNEEYVKYTGRKGRGEFIPKDNVIHINMSEATKTTVAHEIFHAVFLNKVKTDARAAKAAEKMIMSVRKTLANDSDLAKKIDEFASRYDENVQNEERLAELVGVLSSEYRTLKRSAKDRVVDFLKGIARQFGIKLESDFGKDDQSVIDLLNAIARKTAEGKEITEEDVNILEQEQGTGGQVGTFIVPRQSVLGIDTKSAKEDSRDFVRNIVEDVDIREFEGQKFITNMYDHTSAGRIDLGNGHIVNLFGGRNFVPYIMNIEGKKIGDVSTLASFNTQANVDSFIRNVKESGASIFAPHSGTPQRSWQFQHHIFDELTNMVLNDGILTQDEIIDMFNNNIQSKKGKKAFDIFAKKYSTDPDNPIKNLDGFRGDVMQLVSLLDIDMNLSPELRKILNNSYSTNKKVQEELGIKNANQFFKKIEDELNEGVTGGEIMTLIKFDPSTFEVVKTEPNQDIHHPSFGYTLRAKIEGVYQPTKFYKSYDLTDSYTKYNKSGEVVVSKKSDPKFAESNVTSSAGAVPKVAEVSLTPRQQKPIGTQSMQSIIETGRANGFSDASIIEVLKKRGFKVKDINDAMEVKIDLLTELPVEFRRVDGGVSEALKLFNDVRAKLSKFATGKKVNGEIVKPSMSEVRQKAMELMKAHPIYQSQNDQIQMELLSGFDKTLQTRANVSVQREISKIRRDLRQRKIGAKNLKQAQIVLKNFIRKNLPKSNIYSQAQINKLVNAVSNTNLDNFEAQAERVISIVEEQRAKIKKSVVKQIKELVAKKAKVRKTSTGKVRSKGLDAKGQAIFKQFDVILKHVLMEDTEALSRIRAELSQNASLIDDAFVKESKGQRLTQEERRLMNTQIAFETFSELESMTLEDTETLLDALKSISAESMLRLKNRREFRANIREMDAADANSQIRETNPELFDEDGDVLSIEQRRERRKKIHEMFRNKQYPKAIKQWISNYKYSTTAQVIATAKNNFRHLGTLMNLLDRVNDGKTMFTDMVYRRLNRMDEIYLSNKFETESKINSIAKQFGFDKGYKGVKRKLAEIGVTKLQLFDSRGKKYTATLSADQLMRIYALSLNDVQRSKLEKQGINDQVLGEIQNILGTDLVSFAESMVDFLSNEYYNKVNDVYAQVNDVNLGYVSNYFPTKTINPDVNKQLLDNADFSGIFNAETAPAFKERTDVNNPIDLDSSDFTSALDSHIDTMEKYTAYAYGTKRLNDFFKIESVDVLLEELGLKGAVKASINMVINPMSGYNASQSNKVVEFLQRKFTGFALAFKLIQIPKQATSFINAYADYSFFPENSKVPKAFKSAIDIPMFMVDAAATILSMGKDLVGKNGALSEAMEMSASFKNRVRQGLEGDVYGLESGSKTFKKVGNDETRRSRIYRGIKAAAGSPTVIGDIMGVMGYMINYKRNIKNGMSKADAVEAFNNYNATQQTRRGTEKIPLQNNNSALVRSFTMFGSTLFLQMNKAMSSMTNVMRAISSGKMPRRQDMREFILNTSVANGLFAAMGSIAMLTQGNDDDRDRAMRKIYESLSGLNLLYQLPFLGAEIERADLVNRMIDGDTYRQPFSKKVMQPVVNPFSSIMFKMSKIGKADETFDSRIRPIAELILGTQLDPFIGLFNMFSGQEDFEENMYDILGISKSYRPNGGESSGEKKSPKKEMTKSEMKKEFPDMYKDIYGDTDEIEREMRRMRQDILDDMNN